MSHSNVVLGFLDECEPWQLQSYQFPSKLGGKPAWLDLENIPRDLTCEICNSPLTFLCQLYAPTDDTDNFHRTLFVFVCREEKCCQNNSSKNIQVYRNSLPRGNKFYSCDPPQDGILADFQPDKWTKLCNLCGCYAEKHCSKCKTVFYCCREHQIHDWKNGHRNACEGHGTSSNQSTLLFPEFLIDTESENIDTERVDEAKELDKFHELQSAGKTGTMTHISNNEMEQHANTDKDKSFARFKSRVDHYPEQILRHDIGGEPLWIADGPKPERIPNCELCDSPRQFEFEIMPQLLALIKEYRLDWGVIVIYTCSKNCKADGYTREFVYKQDVSQ